MLEFANTFSSYILPVILVFVPLFAFMRGVAVYEKFCAGAKSGIEVALSIFPFLLGMLVAINMFKVSGAMDLLVEILEPVGEFLGLPEELIPLSLMRPISGNGALAITADILETQGADSFLGLLASSICGSTDTTLYVLAIYFGSVGIASHRHGLLVGLIADFSAIFMCSLLCNFYFA